MNRRDRKWEQIEQLFHELTQLSESEKAGRMGILSKENPELYDRMKALLAADEDSHPLFNAEPGSLFSILENDHQLIGSRIRAFELSEVVGQGAMGTVFKGHRVDGQFDQIVAIKLMKPLLINPGYRIFFDRERQILAKLNHPNIARLYDGGFNDDERPFFTMEWVSGKILTDYCREKNLGLMARLELFEQVCQAVRYAHQSLIAHLDLKPQNILINEEGQAKLLDFGVSQMLEESAEQEGSFTLAYAAPEQILKTNPNTVSDIYSLGVILFELLNDVHPFYSHFKDPEGLKKAVLDGSTSPFVLEKIDTIRFSKDLEFICRRAMQVDPADRYASVDEMIRDLDDFGKDYPVSAHPKSWIYHARKYVFRNRKVLAVVNGSFLLLIVMGVYYTFQLREQRNIAQAEAKRANQITGLITDVFSAADPNIGGADTITAVQLLDEGLKNLSKNLGDDPALYADMLVRLASVYISLGQYDQAKQIVEEAYAINLSLPISKPETLANNEILISSTYFMFGQLDSAVNFSRKAVKRLTDAGIYEGLHLVDALLELGSSYYEMDNYLRADSALSAGLTLAQKAYQPPHISLATFLHLKGAIAMKLEDLLEAEKYLNEALEMKRQLYGEPHLEIAYSYNYFGTFYQSQGDFEKALGYVQASLEQRQAILGKYHVEVAASFGNTGRTLIGLDRPMDAVPYYEEAIHIIDSLFGTNHYYYGSLKGSLGNAYFEAKAYDKAKQCYLESLENFDQLLSEDDPRHAAPRIKLGQIATSEGDLETARKYFEEAVRIRERLLPVGHLQIAQSQQALGDCLLAMGDYSTAIDYLEKAHLTANAHPESNSELISQLNYALAEAFQQKGDQEKAAFYTSLISAKE